MKKIGVPPKVGVGEVVRWGGLLQLNIPFLKLKVAILKNICVIWSWNLQGVLELSFPFYKRLKNRSNFNVQNRFGKILNFSRKIPISGFARNIWRHNFVTPWPILVIKVSMVWRDRYLAIDIKIKFIEALIAKIQGGWNPQSPWLDVRWLDERIKPFLLSLCISIYIHVYCICNYVSL